MWRRQQQIKIVQLIKVAIGTHMCLCIVYREKKIQHFLHENCKETKTKNERQNGTKPTIVNLFAMYVIKWEY